MRMAFKLLPFLAVTAVVSSLPHCRPLQVVTTTLGLVKDPSLRLFIVGNGSSCQSLDASDTLSQAKVSNGDIVWIQPVLASSSKVCPAPGLKFRGIRSVTPNFLPFSGARASPCGCYFKANGWASNASTSGARLAHIN